MVPFPAMGTTKRVTVTLTELEATVMWELVVTVMNGMDDEGMGLYFGDSPIHLAACHRALDRMAEALAPFRARRALVERR